MRHDKNGPNAVCNQCSPRPACASAQSDQGQHWLQFVNEAPMALLLNTADHYHVQVACQMIRSYTGQNRIWAIFLVMRHICSPIAINCVVSLNPPTNYIDSPRYRFDFNPFTPIYPTWNLPFSHSHQSVSIKSNSDQSIQIVGHFVL